MEDVASNPSQTLAGLLATLSQETKISSFSTSLMIHCLWLTKPISNHTILIGSPLLYLEDKMVVIQHSGRILRMLVSTTYLYM